MFSISCDVPRELRRLRAYKAALLGSLGWSMLRGQCNSKVKKGADRTLEEKNRKTNNVNAASIYKHVRLVLIYGWRCGMEMRLERRREASQHAKGSFPPSNFDTEFTPH
jgi:preprotein translocase subunit Sec63